MTVLMPGQQKPVSIYNLNSHLYTTIPAAQPSPGTPNPNNKPLGSF